MNQLLSQELKSATQEAHKNAEGAKFVSDLFKGRCTKMAYALYLWGLNKVYQTLEKTLDLHKDNPAIEKIYWPTLFRTKTLQSDLENWRASLPEEIPSVVSDSVVHYCKRIETLGESHPELLVAHAYVRYLGDLSGGQMLGRVLPQRFEQKVGFYFYDFGDLEIDETKRKYRKALDQIGEQNKEKIESFCEEAKNSFLFNSRLFQSLDQIH